MTRRRINIAEIAVAVVIWWLGILALSRDPFPAHAQTIGQNFADDEAPGAQPDGVNQFFRMQHVPVVSSVKVYRNGIRVTRGLDFAVYPGGAFPRVGFFPCCIPQTGDILRFDYRW